MISRQAKREKVEIYFWNEFGFCVDEVQGLTWGMKEQTSVIMASGQHQCISVASAVNSKRSGLPFIAAA